jgi:hypothetical protein
MGTRKSKSESQRRGAEPTLGVDCPEMDPEGWMLERLSYWADLRKPVSISFAQDRGDFPTGAAYLRRRIRELVGELIPLGRGPAPAWPVERVDAVVWRAAASEALGSGTASAGTTMGANHGRA